MHRMAAPLAHAAGANAQAADRQTYVIGCAKVALEFTIHIWKASLESSYHLHVTFRSGRSRSGFGLCVEIL
jgi:hypothetical protein